MPLRRETADVRLGNRRNHHGGDPLDESEKPEGPQAVGEGVEDRDGGVDEKAGEARPISAALAASVLA